MSLLPVLLALLAPATGQSSDSLAQEPDASLSCVGQYACNVRGANLLGYYNISQEAIATSVQEVRLLKIYTSAKTRMIKVG